MAFYLGMVLQKADVHKLQEHHRLMLQLIRNPLWLKGFAIQFIIEVPLNLVAAAFIGPAIIPGLIATSLIVLVIDSIRISQEAFSTMDALGIILVMGAVTLFGLSGLGIDLKTVELYDPGFLSRLGAFTLLVACPSLLCYLSQKKRATTQDFFARSTPALYSSYQTRG